MSLIHPLIAFALAAVIGLTLALKVLRGKMVPWLYSLLHALFGATGLVLLCVFIFSTANVSQTVLLALLALLLVAFGGFFLASFHLRGKIPPKLFVFVHAGFAVAGVLTLLAQII